MNTRFTQPAANKSARPLALVLAAVVTLTMLQSIDSLASREHGASMMTRAATSLLAAVRGSRAA